MSSGWSLAVFLVTIALGGIVGSWTRYLRVFREGSQSRPMSELEPLAQSPLRERVIEVVIPGVAAAFVVPLFLSIGRNDVISTIVKSADPVSVTHEILIIFGFCILAGAAAPNFIDNLARRAFDLASRNQQKISTLDQKAEDHSELVAEVIENSDSPPKMAGDEDRNEFEGNFSDTSDEENSVLKALKHSNFVRRTVTGISKETGIGKYEVREILLSLIKKGYVIQVKSDKTGAYLYQLSLSKNLS